jgi:hypothetical protein
VFAGSTTTTEVDVWTSTTIGLAIVNNHFNAHAGTQIDEYVFANSSGYWNAVTDSIVPQESEPTSRAPQTGVLSYTLATPGNYYGQAAWHCADNTVIYYYACFDTWFPTYNDSIDNTNPWYYDGPPQVNSPSTMPGNGPGSSGTITLTGKYIVDPFLGSGAAGVAPVPGDSRLTLNVNSWSVNSTTGVETVVVGYSVSSNASIGASSFTFKDHFGSSIPIPFNILPPPVIDGPNGSPINSSASSPIQVLAGAPISLSVASPSGQTIQSQSWVFGTPGDAVGGYNASAASGCYIPVSGSGGCPGTSFVTSQANLGPFFFIVPGKTEKVTVSVTYSGGATASTEEWYSVGGPTGSVLPSASLQTDDSATTILNPNVNPATLKMTNSPSFQSVGVSFKDSATLPQGSLVWVQILQKVNYSFLVPTTSAWVPPANLGVGLDGFYPYPAASQNSTNDAPSVTLLGGLGEAAESFDAIMYVLWDPAIPPAGLQSCTPATTSLNYVSTQSTCASIPVPLGSVEWKWSACTINQLAAPAGVVTPFWIKQCGPGFSYPATTSGYPTWNSCDKSDIGIC